MRWEKFTLSGHLHRQKSQPVTLMRILWLAAAMAVDIVLCFVITICTYYFIAWKIFTPTERGFYCNDESIQNPLFENTVPTSWLLAITLALPFFTIVLANFLSKSWDDIRERMVHVIQLSTYVYLDYVVGFWVMTLILDIIKCLVGRLRPNFIAMCMPDASYLSACQANSTAFITDIVCTNVNWRKARNARMSFPSGHAAAALFSALFIHYFLSQLHSSSSANITYITYVEMIRIFPKFGPKICSISTLNLARCSSTLPKGPANTNLEQYSGKRESFVEHTQRSMKEDEKGSQLFSAGQLLWSRIKKSMNKNALPKSPLDKKTTELFDKSASQLYIDCANRIAYVELTEQFGMPDHIMSWFKLTVFHMWMVLLRLHTSMDAQCFIRFKHTIIAALWSDFDSRVITLFRSNTMRKPTYKETSVIHGSFLVSLIDYDEGFLMNDAHFAAAIWRNIYDGNQCDPICLANFVQYARATVSFLDKIDTDSLLISGVRRWDPAEEIKKLQGI
ncbi:ubiquinol-cytochrome C chaperone domain-containing protein [Ditylenchus destructor]|nr:ubiquinol-cytochrome C chaperone domain-containing protein [Ditylenchus destructor]